MHKKFKNQLQSARGSMAHFCHLNSDCSSGREKNSGKIGQKFLIETIYTVDVEDAVSISGL